MDAVTAVYVLQLPISKHVGTIQLDKFYKDIERKFYVETGKYVNAKRYKERWTVKCLEAGKEEWVGRENFRGF
jgi:hypothetical protein